MLIIRVTDGKSRLLFIFLTKNGGEKAVSGKYLTMQDREKIAKAWNDYASVAEIAESVGVAKKTVYAELERGWDGKTIDKNQRRAYDPAMAQRRFHENMRRRGARTAVQR